MAMLTTTNGASAVLPETIAELVTRPVEAASIAFGVSRVIRTATTETRIPIVSADPVAAWTAEGADIAASATTLTEIKVRPSKLAAFVPISRELADDSSPDAQATIGSGIARDIAKQVDSAFFGATITNGPSGLGSLTGVQTVDTAGTIANTDVFAEAISKAETVGAKITSFVANPVDVLAMAKVKKATGSNEPLLGSDATVAGSRTILGVPLISSPAVDAGTIWAIPADRVCVVLREDVDLQVDRSYLFKSDQVAIRATLRAGFGFPHEEAIVRIHDAT